MVTPEEKAGGPSSADAGERDSAASVISRRARPPSQAPARPPAVVVGRILDGLIETGILALLVWITLPYGGVVPWAEALLLAHVTLLAGLTAIRMLVAGEVTVRWSPLLLPGVVFLFLVVAQLLVPALRTVSPWATWDSGRLYLAYFLFLVVLAVHLTTRGRVLRLTAVLTAWGTLVAGVGLAGWLLGHSIVPWAIPVMSGKRLTAFLVSPNHQALFLAVTFFLGLGLLLRPGRGPRPPTPAGAPRPAAFRLTSWLVEVGLVTALGVIGLAFVLTLSRGGLMAFGAGVLVVLILGTGSRLYTRTALLAVLGTVVLLGVWVGVGPMLGRLEGGAETFADLRWPAYERTLAMAGERPFLGFGLGTYADVFTRFQPPGVPVGRIIDHAHNDYLELFAETGLTGVAILAWALLGLVSFVIGRWVRRHDPWTRGLVLGALGALTAVLVHSVLDFGLRIPAVALCTTAVGALLVNGVTLRTRHGAGAGVELPAWTRPVAGWARAAGLAAVAGLLVIAGMALTPLVQAGFEARAAERLAGGRVRDAGQVTMSDLTRAQELLRRALARQPRSPRLAGQLGDTSAEIAVRAWAFGLGPDGKLLPRDPGRRLEASQPYFAAALLAYRQALAGNPVSAVLHDRYANLLMTLDDVVQRVRGSARLRMDDPALAGLVESDRSLLADARRHLEESVRLDPQNSRRQRSLAVFALARLSGDDATFLASSGFRRALDAEPGLLPEVLDYLVAAGSGRGVVAAAMPARDDVWLALAQEWQRRSRQEEAGWAFREALARSGGPARQLAARLAYGRFLLATGYPRDALEQTRQALVLQPNDARVFVTLAAIYEALNQPAEAVGALTSAVSSTGPSNPQATLDYLDQLASLHARLGQVDQAIAVRQRRLELRPGDAGEHFQLGRLHEAKRQWPEALRQFRTALAASPSNYEMKRHIATSFARNGLGSEAVAMLERDVRVEPGLLELRLTLAELYLSLNQPDRALDQYREVLARQPGHPEARRQVASLRARTGGGS